MKTKPFWALSVMLLLVGTATAEPKFTATRQSDPATGNWFQQSRFGICFDLRAMTTPSAGTTVAAASWQQATDIGVSATADSQSAKASQWVRAAKEIGAKYIIVEVNPAQRNLQAGPLLPGADGTANGSDDIISAVAQACRKQGIRFGIRCSFGNSTAGEEIAFYLDPSKSASRSDTMLISELKRDIHSLCTNYGKLDAMWIEFGKLQLSSAVIAEMPRIAEMIHRLQPNALISDLPGYVGDVTPMNRLPIDTPLSTASAQHGWELNVDLGRQLPVAKRDLAPAKLSDAILNDKPSLLRLLIDVASKGGNLLVEVEPTQDRPWPAGIGESLTAVGQWLAINGDAIYGSSANPFLTLPFDGTATIVDNKLYAIIFRRPAEGMLRLPGLRSIAKSARIIGGPQIGIQNVGLDVITADFTTLPTRNFPLVVAIDLVGNGDVDTFTSRLDAHANLTLQSRAAIVAKSQHVRPALFEVGSRVCLGATSLATTGVEWRFDLSQSGNYEVFIDYSNAGNNGDAKIELAVGTTKLIGHLAATSSEEEFRSSKIGDMDLFAGLGSVELKLTQISRDSGIKIHGVRFAHKGATETSRYLSINSIVR